MTTTAYSAPAKAEAFWLLDQSRRAAARTLREFAEQEIVIPDGEYKGQLFRVSRQPFVGLLYDEIDSGRWQDFVITGPSQSGKTLCAFVIPTLYHALELRETLIIGLPDADMSGDKWSIDIKPVIEQSGFAHLLPETGSGSRGGRRVEAVEFQNGATLKIMTGGGGDKSRAGFTARVLVITETDGMDEAGAASREADKISQLQARQRSFPRHRRRTYKECTVSTSSGRTWREYNNASSRSRIVCQCPHKRCREWVTPERPHLVGWKDAQTQREAMRLATFVCPACAKPITTEQQREANAAAKLLHGDQRIDKRGRVTGALPETDRLGFRWSAFNNLFLTAADHAADEWAAAQYGENTEQRINAEKELNQFIWALPADDVDEDLIELEVPALLLRTGSDSQPPTQRGIIPAGHDFLTVGVDIRSRQLHYVVKSSDPLGNCRVIAYDILKVHSQRLGLEPAILRALQYLRDDILAAGFVQAGESQPYLPDLVFIDSGWTPAPIYEFTAESLSLPTWESDDQTFWPIIGRGDGKQYGGRYTQPQTVGQTVKIIGPDLHVRVNKKFGQLYCIIDADASKAWAHARWATPLEESGAATVHVATGGDHNYFFKQITAERVVETFEDGKGTTRRWVVSSRVNHYLDADAYASAALRWLGVEPTQVDETETIRGEADAAAQEFLTPSGRPFF